MKKKQLFFLSKSNKRIKDKQINQKKKMKLYRNL